MGAMSETALSAYDRAYCDKYLKTTDKNKY